MADEVPAEFTSRQLNDTRYISKFIRTLLSNIVREEGEQEAVSKHIVTCVGSITDRAKKDWGLGDVWNRIVLPRFERMNEITSSTDYTTNTANGHLIPSMPLDKQEGFNKKRIDHRHHAMDAIVIACIDRNIVNYLNNVSASSSGETTRQDLKHLVCVKHKLNEKDYEWILRKPWAEFTEDTYRQLRDIVVSFKQNLRVINKTSNRIQHFDADGKKHTLLQTKGDSWAIRKSLHKETVFGEVNLRQIKSVKLSEAIKNPKRIVEKDLKRQVLKLLAEGYDDKRIKAYFDENQDMWRETNLNKIDVYIFTNETKDRYYASRKAVDTTFDVKRITDSVTDTGIQKILLRHLEANDNKPAVAFSPEGIEEMNRNILSLNDGKPHQPIYKVRCYEKANKYAVGQRGNKGSKFVEAAKGTNLFFAIYETQTLDKKTGELVTTRSYDTIPFREVVARFKEGLPAAPCKDGVAPKYVISPNGLVYLPTEAEVKSGKVELPLDRERIYKFVSSAGSQSFFVKEDVSGLVVNNVEFSPLNKMERAITGEMIKETCIPIKVDRLGNVVEIGGEKV
jgi:CRISPR-associated endonuclease Csn1